MAFASVGARTPFITSTPSNAVMLLSPATGATLRLGLGLGFGLGVGLGFGLAAAGAPSALFAVAAFSFVGFPSLFPARAGTAVMAITSRLDNHLFTVNMDGVLLLGA